ncbi:MAG: ABC transporter ATP-binding protein [Candidatus Hodarchaeales archaeon]
MHVTSSTPPEPTIRTKSTSLPTDRYSSATRWYFSFFRRSPKLVTLSLAISLISSLLMIAPSLFLGMALEVLDRDGFTQQFIDISLLMIIVAIFSFAFTFISNYSWTIAAFRFERDTRQEFFDTIQAHSMTFHDEIDSSQLLSMAMNEISQMRMGINPSLRMLSSSFLSMIFTLIAFYVFDPLYFVIVIIGFPIYFVMVVRYAARIGPVRKELADRLAVVTRDSQEIFRGIEVVRSNNQEEKENNRFINSSKRYAEMVTKEGRLSAFFWPALVLITITAVIFGLGMMNIQTSEDVSRFAASVSILIGLQFMNFMLPMSVLNIRAGMVNANRIWKKMSWQDPVPDIAIEGTPDWNGDIVFKDVSLKYGTSSKYALENINISIPKGSKVAIIGGPGSGKSSFLKLLLRLYDPSEGIITINNIPMTEIPAFNIRKGVCMVEQEVFLFSASVRENIAFAKPSASISEIEIAAENAQAKPFIEKMSDGFDTVIGERGITLSGGQKQRLAIARALLADPKVLLLDDSASAIDSKTEMFLRKALDNLMKNRTSIVVTQRLATLIESDFIILFEKGKICSVGPHDILLKESTQYRKIFANLPEIVGGNA